MRVKCLAQEHNTMSPARAQTQTARSRDECTNHEATTPPPMEVANFEFTDFRKQEKYNGLKICVHLWSAWQNPEQGRTNWNSWVYFETTVP